MDKMTKEEVKKKVIQAIADCLNIDPGNIKNRDDLTCDFCADDLDYKNIGMTLSERFDIEIADHEIDDASLVRDVIALAEEKLDAKGLLIS